MANEIKENTDLTQEIKQNLLKTWKVFSSAPLTYFKSLWPALLVNCIGVAFFAVVIFFKTEGKFKIVKENGKFRFKQVWYSRRERSSSQPFL